MKSSSLLLQNLYFYVDPPRLVDPQAIKDRTSDIDSVARSQQDFKQALIARDGTCIITGENADDCDASHCLPHSKGDQVHFSFVYEPIRPHILT